MSSRNSLTHYNFFALVRYAETFCRKLDSKESRVFHYKMLGLLEAVDRAFSIMKSPKDIFFLDLDNNSKCNLVTEDQIRRL